MAIHLCREGFIYVKGMIKIITLVHLLLGLDISSVYRQSCDSAVSPKTASPRRVTDELLSQANLLIELHIREPPFVHAALYHEDR